MANAPTHGYENLTFEKFPLWYTNHIGVLELIAHTLGIKLHDFYARIDSRISIVSARPSLLQLDKYKILGENIMEPIVEDMPLPDAEILAIKERLGSEEEKATFTEYITNKLRDNIIFYDSFIYNYGYKFKTELESLPYEIISHLKCDTHMRLFLNPAGKRYVHMRYTLSDSK